MTIFLWIFASAVGLGFPKAIAVIYAIAIGFGIDVYLLSLPKEQLLRKRTRLIAVTISLIGQIGPFVLLYFLKSRSPASATPQIDSDGTGFFVFMAVAGGFILWTYSAMMVRAYQATAKDTSGQGRG